MSTNTPPAAHLRPPPSRLWSAFKALFRARVTQGLIVVLPIWVTILLVKFVFGLMRDATQWIVYAVLHGDWRGYLPASWSEDFHSWSNEELSRAPVQWGIALFSVALTLFLLYLIGLLMANYLGRRTLELMETLVDKVPLVKTVYRASKQIMSTFTGEQSTSFQRVALIPFMSEHSQSIGFITNTFREERTGEEMVTIFYATTPNPTTGFILICKRRDVVELDWSVEEAVKAIMSGGILLPERVRLSARNSAKK